MNGKMHSEGAPTPDDRRAEILNPFVHKLELENTYDKIKEFFDAWTQTRVRLIASQLITAWMLACVGSRETTSKTAIFTVILLPFRVIVICYLVITAWMLACVGLYGLTEEQLRKKPMTGWRRKLRIHAISLMRGLVYASGFHTVRVRGAENIAREPRDAPVLCVAPHSSFFDAIAIVWLGAPSVVAKGDTAKLPFIGQLINYTQPVYVWRDDPNSRQNSIKEIIERATSKEDWPQVLIFPEGTCTNRSCLITFKPGGFYPGVPVQPVTIRYPNSLDTVTWTWEGPGALKLLWLTLTQVHSSCEIEFLPVYYPDEEEKKDPKLYARNVRDVMAKALGVPVLDYTYDDCRLLTKAKHMAIPGSSNIVEIQKLRNTLGLEASQIELHIAGKPGRRDRWTDLAEFSKRLGVSAHDDNVQRLYNLFVQKQCRLVSWPDYLLCAVFLSLQHAPIAQILSYAFKIYDTSETGRMSLGDFEEMSMRCLGLYQEDANHAFRQADLDEKGYITYDEFICFAQKKAEFSFIFNCDSVHQKPKSQ